MEQRTDQELLAEYRRGDQRAFAFFVQRYLPGVHRFLFHMVGDAAMADDLAQETFVKAWQKLGSYHQEKPFKSWILTIARNTAIDFLRKKNPLTFSELDRDEAVPFADTLADERPLSDALMARHELGEKLEEALGELSPDARSVVLLHGLGDLTFQEIADTMRQPMNTVKSRYRRAMEALKTYLKKRLDSEDLP